MAPAAAGEAQAAREPVVTAPVEAPVEIPSAKLVAAAEPVAPPQAVAAEPAPSGEGNRPRRARRPRAARSAQGSASEPIQRSEAVAATGQGSTHVAKLPETAQATAPAARAAEPMILGVGVPASEL